MLTNLRAPAFAVLATALLVCSQGTGVTGLPGVARDLPDFEARLERLRQLLVVPGMAAAIGHNGAIPWTGSFGLADVAGQRVVRDTTTFHLASLTKLFGTVVLLRLVDSGLVSLDDPVSDWGVTVQSSGTVRVRHLLSMTSDASPPGSSFAYNGDRFALLDTVIFRASGRRFADLAAAWILRPLGLTRTAPNVDSPAFAFSGLDAASYRATMARPYAVQGQSVSLGAYPSHFSVSAGMTGTASEVVRFAQALDSGTVLSPAMRAVMFTPATTGAGAALPYASGCFSQLYGGVRVIWAYGLWTANSSLVIHVPERGLTFAVVANADRLSAPYRLGAGRLLDSPLAQEFLNAFVLQRTIELP